MYAKWEYNILLLSHRAQDRQTKLSHVMALRIRQHRLEDKEKRKRIRAHRFLCGKKLENQNFEDFKIILILHKKKQRELESSSTDKEHVDLAS